MEMELLHLCVPKLSCLKGHPDASETCRLTGPAVGLGWSSFKVCFSQGSL